MPIRDDHPAIIFDLDGTLADTLDDITVSLNHALERVGAPHRSRGQAMAMIGDGAVMLTRRALGPHHEYRLDDALACFAAHYHAHALDHSRLFPGIDVQLDRLADTGWRFAILSNKPHVYTRQCARVLLNRWRFTAIRGAVEHAPKKPDPAAARDIATRLQTEPERIYFAGDSAVDIQTARNAGMIAVACLWGYGDRHALQSAGAQLTVRTPDDLASALETHAARQPAPLPTHAGNKERHRPPRDADG